MNASTWLDHLPPAFREGETANGLLLALETVFTDSEATVGHDQPSFEEQIVSAARWFRPTGDRPIPADRPEFLEWLAELLAVGFRLDWDDLTKRRVLSEAVPLFRLRGTRAGLERMLQLHLTTGTLAEDGREQTRAADALVKVMDTEEELGFVPPPFYFAVQITVHHSDPVRLRRDQRIAEALIDQEKPAHTYYGLNFATPGIQLGVGLWELGKENTVL